MRSMEAGAAKVYKDLIWQDPDRVSGAPCFYRTRVPIDTLFQYLESGEPLDAFLEGFPSVTREQAVAVLELARAGALHIALGTEAA